MLTWMVYVMSVSLLLGAAALAAEYRARLRRAPSRWFWMAAIVASLLIPTVIASVSVQLPSVFSSVFSRAVSQKVIVLREVTSARLSPSNWIGENVARTAASPSMEAWLQQAWRVVSGLMAVVLMSSGLHLYFRKRRWIKSALRGVPVYLANDVGPAVVGLINPCIVVPTWLMHSPVSQQTAVIAHEQSHLDAGDQRLLTVALCLLVFMPWNLPLWWQLRRLRYAIEIDCDARVLKGGQDITNYGETLVAVGERQSGYIGAVAAMSESKSFLERRIKIMMHKPTKWWRISAATLGCLSVGLFAVAAQVSPPNAGSSESHEMKEISVPITTLAKYVGYYQFGDNAVMTVTLNGHQLSTQLTGQPAVEIYPASTTGFFLKLVKAQIDFVPDEQGYPTALVLHQNGATITAPRVDAAMAEQINSTTQAKVKSQVPTPGSEAALRRLIAGISAGEPNFAEMSSQLAEATRQQLPQLQLGLKNLGAVQSVEFRGVGNAGWDIYEVKHERGSSQWRIALSNAGVITGALVSAGP